MQIRLADPEDKASWDAYVDCSGAAPYCRFAWKEAVEQVYGHKGYYLMAEEGHKIIGIFPLFYFRIPCCRASFISLPYCDVGSVHADSPEIHSRLIQEAFRLAKAMDINTVELRSSQENLLREAGTDWHVRVQAGKVRMLLELPDSSEDLWQSFKSKLRSQINKAEKNGLTFAWGNREMVDDFYQVFSRNMHDLGSPVHSKRWIEQIVDGFGENARIGMVFHKDRPVGCGIILHTRATISLPWASTLREYNRLAPNMMLYWNLLRFAADGTFKTFDFGRSTPDEGTYQFKKQWGAAPVPLFWYQANLTSGSRKSDNNRSIKREFLADLWTKMPLCMANSIGPKVRKYISL
jgi:FemAB-related protein (PEP-CTERM system-associated)